MIQPSRRQFLKSSAVVAGVSLAPNILIGQDKPSKELNVASVGCAGKGASDIGEIQRGNHMVALCDIDQSRSKDAAAKFPDAKVFTDFREMFDQMSDKIDVVTVSIPDHSHFPVAMEAIRRGKHVMVQKPLCNTIWEARVLANYAKQKGVFTVMGNQGATKKGTRILREWIEAGVIGQVKEVYYWTNRPIWPQGKGLSFPTEPVPSTINWEVWQGTVATNRPYSPKIHPFAWRGFWDYGCGALGDIGCHSMNSVFWALDLQGDLVVEANDVGEFDEATAPKRANLTYQFPAKGKRGPVKVFWQDGIDDPNKDPRFKRPPGIPADLQLNKEYGQVFVGTDGVIFLNDAYGESMPEIYPESLKAKAATVKEVYPRVEGGPTQELCRAVRGTGPKPVSNFVDHAGPLTEMVLAGNLAVRSGKKIDWDSAKMEVRGMPELKSMLKRTYRPGWEPKLA